ncbi:hypothetical protein FIBSPDRAFT_874357 [Athelia psychrophila]|uniref:Secreted protein n=1 Tax=Athelia psychrophila TaxID=1759441 RepID=A0A165XM98_9AGAM|nr:hypothetical protein FIBSPDRAFT_874351 [Fibularhizoctonia sp. CBS 109695]KZP08695.1 hypothetical protein FIBSPDRAFT_874357 [Fibularhizoctonia sp. CBS 109695]
MYFPAPPTHVYRLMWLFLVALRSRVAAKFPPNSATLIALHDQPRSMLLPCPCDTVCATRAAKVFPGSTKKLHTIRLEYRNRPDMTDHA